MPFRHYLRDRGLLRAVFRWPTARSAQMAPTPERDRRLHGSACGRGQRQRAEIERLVKEGADINARDGIGRTPLMVAAFRQDVAAAQALIEAGANLNALDNQSYDVITIAAVLNDLEMLELAHRRGRQHARHHQPLQRHGADRGGAPGPRRDCARR